MDRTVVQRHNQLSAGARPGLIGLPHVDVLIRCGIVTKATTPSCYCFGQITCGIAQLQVTGPDEGEPTAKIPKPLYPLKLNFTGMALPA
jgi:hypothetical protein